MSFVIPISRKNEKIIFLYTYFLFLVPRKSYLFPLDQPNYNLKLKDFMTRYLEIAILLYNFVNSFMSLY